MSVLSKLEGKIIVTGGFLDGKYSDRVESYDLDGGYWDAIHSLSIFFFEFDAFVALIQKRDIALVHFLQPSKEKAQKRTI